MAGLAAADAVLVSTALVVAVVVRFGTDPTDVAIGGLSYAFVAVAVAASWCASLAAAGAYATRHLGTGPE